MAHVEFVTVDVFAEAPFQGNQLAVLPDARDVPAPVLQSIAREFRFSETAFVLPPERGGTARVRIFTLDGEAAFAGHPLVGTGVVVAAERGLDRLVLEVPAGDCVVSVEHRLGARRACVETPQVFSIDAEVPVGTVARALGVPLAAVVTTTHAPTAAGMGRPFVVVETTRTALDDVAPDAAAFEAARTELGSDRFAVLAYARGGPGEVVARMFSPLTGTAEDAATGSANVALAGLLLHHAPELDKLELVSRQGIHLGRPSTLYLRAWRAADGIRASVAGDVVAVTAGRLRLP